MELSPGTKLNDQYEVLSVLGKGSGGITYKVRDIKLHKIFAIKELFIRELDQKPFMERDVQRTTEVWHSPQKEDRFLHLKQRFLEEARNLAKIRSEAIVEVYNYFETNQTAYIVMEYLEGYTLAQEIKERVQIPAEEVFEKLFPLIEALEHVHEMHIIHRDIKPENIMCRPNGRYCLFDFGIAREITDGTNCTAYGTPAYAPPEQLSSDFGTQGPWGDVYSLSATAYHAITGKPPESVVYRTLVDDMALPSDQGIAITPDEEKALMKGLSLDPKERYQTMKAMADTWAVRMKKAEKDVKKKLFFHRLFPVAAIVIVLVCCLLVWRKNEGYRYDPEKDYQILLTPDDTFSVTGWFDAQKILKKRLELLVGPGKYKMQVNENEIWLSVNKQIFSKDSPEQVLRFYLTRPTDLYVVHQDKDMYEKIRLERKDFEMAVCDKLPDTIRKDENDSAEKYMRFTLSEEFPEKNKEFFEKYGQAYVIAQDAENNDVWCSYFTYFQDENVKECYCSMEKGYEKVLAYNVEHEPLESSFTFQITEQMQWLGEEEQYGKNQVLPEQLPENTMSMVIRVSTQDRETGKADMANMYQNLALRLDGLDSPYSMGEVDPLTMVSQYADAENYRYIIVRMGDDVLEPELLQLLICPKYDFNVLKADTREYYAVKGAELVQEDGSAGLLLDIAAKGNAVTDTFLHLWESDAQMQKALAQGEGWYLYYGLPYTALMEVSQAEKDGETEEDNRSAVLADRLLHADAAQEKNSRAMVFIQSCINNELWDGYSYQFYGDQMD